MTTTPDRVPLEDVARLCAELLEALPPDDSSALDQRVRDRLEAFSVGVTAATDSAVRT